MPPIRFLPRLLALALLLSACGGSDAQSGPEALPADGPQALLQTATPNAAPSSRARIVDIDTGEQHSIAVLDDGTVWTWGLSGNGQLGREVTIEDYGLPRLAEGVSGTMVSAGSAYSFVYDGTTLWGTGYNASGYLGWGPSGDEQTFTAFAFPDLVDIDAHGAHVIALMADSTVRTWGEGSVGQVGNGTRPNHQVAPVLVAHQVEPGVLDTLDQVVAIAAGGAYSLVLRADSTVWAWGQNYYATLGTPEVASAPPPNPSGAASASGAATAWFSTIPVASLIDNVVAIAAGENHALAVRADGTVWGWGSNRHSALAHPDENAVFVEPTQIEGLTDVVSVAAGSGYSLALKSDGTVWMWGTMSGLSNYPSPFHTIRRVTPLQNIVMLAADHHHALAASEAGTLWGWGSNDQGQVGSEEADETQYPPVRVSFPN
ncbi:MAG: hypothetical protein HKN04_09880 [Rhodothermaceae bacterium]|nr:hypothetical protein [Rhodothermaceae bacterium]